MDKLHFVSYCAAIVAWFIWNQWMLKSSRLWRALGAAAIIVGVALIFPWALQHVSPK